LLSNNCSPIDNNIGKFHVPTFFGIIENFDALLISISPILVTLVPITPFSLGAYVDDNVFFLEFSLSYLNCRGSSFSCIW
jgi:hypothetical protein